ncbi:conserved hypothetical protein [Leptospira interrogans serovar Manilae]|uniref:DUF4303 domain-containing protein n=3 Tax=Leptospira interrogans TaxID=173 RepID=A0AAQ1SNM1_LEPIR|nr:DUF4303 domain-containing protein [Leptospira interrogans]AKP25215.1 hypothetical protein LIMLP_04115 [Leptospira interrogans serovar Manilae]AKP28999.1 hypothetical protein LIMHP_04100 [Leptospira interrogans serovar Manilae]EYU62223.1 hypothetical protein CI00_00585 [Leptospira interrogans serovar Manilae]SOR61613.1 conserved hypothetical protein [Leptospira interrogans serovar Manilae]
MNQIRLIQKHNVTECIELNLEKEQITIQQYENNNRILSQTYEYENSNVASKELEVFIKWKAWEGYYPEEEGPDYADRWRNYWLNNFPEKNISPKRPTYQLLIEAVNNRDIEFFIANEDTPGIELKTNSAKFGDPILIYAIKTKSIAIVDYLLHTMWLEPSVKDQNRLSAWDHIFQAKDSFLGNLFLENIVLLGTEEEIKKYRIELGLPAEEETSSFETKVKDNHKHGFDVDVLTNFAIQKIKFFAKDHVDETFYGFAIDASYIKMNSIETFEKTLEEYQSKWPNDYNTPEKIQTLKNNIGDWKYTLADFIETCNENEDGFMEGPFNEELYDKHYNASDLEQKDSEYAKAMDSILNNLIRQETFRNLKTSIDFSCLRSEHNY